jgi:hypothetical protein
VAKRRVPGAAPSIFRGSEIMSRNYLTIRNEFMAGDLSHNAAVAEVKSNPLYIENARLELNETLDTFADALVWTWTRMRQANREKK